MNRLHRTKTRHWHALVVPVVVTLIAGCSGSGSEVAGSGGGGGGPASPLTKTPDEPFSASGLEGGIPNPSTKVYALSSDADFELTFDVDVPVPWLAATPSSGTISARGSFDLQVSLINPAVVGLPVGDHSARVRVLERLTGAEASSIDVLVRVDPGGQGYSMNLVPRQGLTSNGQVGGPFTPSQQSYAWTNNGNGALSYTRSVSEAWVQVTGPESGTVAPQETIGFDVSLDTATIAGFAPGNYVAAVELFSGTSPGQPIDTIDVNLQVDPSGPSMELVPPSGFFATGPQGGPLSPSQQSYTWSNVGDQPASYTRTISVPWLDVTGPASGTVNQGQQIQFTISLNAAANNLAIGRHFGSVNLRDAQGQLMEQIDIGVSLSDPAGSGVRILTNRSTYTTAPHHAHFSAMNCTFNDGGIEDAQIEWWCRRHRDNAVYDSMFGVPEFGVVFDEPGDYTVYLRVRGRGESAWVEDTIQITVDPPSYVAECWLDTNAASNGSGTSSSAPFNSWSAAFGYITSNWSNGPTNEFAIHCARGMTGSTTTGWNADYNPRVGRLVVKPYGAGADPAVTYNGGDTFIRNGDDAAMAVVDMDINCGGSAGPVRHDVRGDSGPDGINMIVLNCTFRNFMGLYVQIDSGKSSTTAWDNGAFDFVAIKNCDWTDRPQHALGLVDGARYYLSQGNSFGAYPTQFGFRHGVLMHGLLRDNVHVPGNGAIFRIHSTAGGSVETQWVAVADCAFTGDDIWMQPDDGNGTTSPMRHIWFVRNRVDATGQPRAMGFHATERAVIRNNWLRSDGAGIGQRPGPGISTATGWIIENNSVVYQATYGSPVLLTLGATSTDFTIRNNLAVCPNVGRGNAVTMFRISSGTDPGILDACDGNHLEPGSATVEWASGFTVSGASLGTWRANTVHDRDSRDNAVSGFAAPSAAPMDLHIGANSTAIDSGVSANGVYVDIDGNVRTGAMDAGADDRAASSPPSPPWTP